MIAIQLRQRAKLALHQPLYLSDAARILGPDKAGRLRLPCPDERGIWKLQAITVLKLVQSAFPGEEVTMLGPDACCIHRIASPGRDLTRPLRTAAALTILCLGSALGLAWFHADVNMPTAQLAVFQALTGSAPPDARWITIPYVLGVALGVAVFYSLPSRKSTTPLEVKLTEYQQDMESTEGRDFDDD